MILIIDNYDSFTYNLVDLVKRCTNQPICIKRNDQVTKEDILALAPDAIIISPGPCTPKEAGYSVGIVKDFGSKIPIMGICLGHQSIGAAYGAHIQAAGTIMHGRIDNIALEASPLFNSLNPSFQGTRYHSLEVSRHNLPHELKVIATSQTDQCIMAIQHKLYPVFGLQFHPESYGTKDGEIIMRNFLSTIPISIHDLNKGERYEPKS